MEYAIIIERDRKPIFSKIINSDQVVDLLLTSGVDDVDDRGGGWKK